MLKLVIGLGPNLLVMNYFDLLVVIGFVIVVMDLMNFDIEVIPKFDSLVRPDSVMVKLIFRTESFAIFFFFLKLTFE